MKTLFEDGEALKINKEFAQKFEARKDKEELHRLRTNSKLRKRRIKPANFTHAERSTDDDSSDDEEEEDEDSDAELVTKEVGAKVLETISRIQLRRKEIYDEKQQYFDDGDFKATGEKKKKEDASEKRLTFTKFMCSTLKNEGSEAFVRDEEDEAVEPPAVTSTYEEEQKALRNAFLDAANRVDDADGVDDLLQAKENTEGEKIEADLAFHAFLKKRALEKASNESQLLQRYFHASEELNDRDAFLRDYILFEGWKEGNRMPQGHIQEDQKQFHNRDDDACNEEEDEQVLEATNQFEAAYNFRFEEGEAPAIEGHARRVLDSVRVKDDKRRRKRLERSERKKIEKEEKRRELERLKYLKRKELMERLKIIQKVAGIKCDLDPSQIDLDKEFDENDHDKQMRTILGEDFDEQRETEENEDRLLETPLELVTTVETPAMSAKQRKKIQKLASKQAKLKAREADDGEAYPAVLSQSHHVKEEEHEKREALQCETTEYGEESLWFLCDGCRSGIPGGAKRFDCLVCENFTLCTKCFRSVRHPHQLTRKRVPPQCRVPEDYQVSTAEHGLPFACDEIGTSELTAETEMTEEQRAVLNDMIDEYYSLEYEDIIGGDLPVRFKYTKVSPEDYGLSTKEILTKSDKQLNQHVSLKKLAPYKQQQHFKRWSSRKSTIDGYHDNQHDGNCKRSFTTKRKSDFNNNSSHVKRRQEE